MMEKWSVDSSSSGTAPITWRTKMVYGSGAIAYGVKDVGFSYFLLFYYSQVVGLPAGWVSAALLLASVIDAIADLVIGQVSDNWNSRLGRRHPFMYASALPAAIVFALLWNPPAWPAEHLIIYMVVMTVSVRIFISLYEIPGNALVPELTKDYNQRTSFFSYRFFFAYWGGLLLNLVTLTWLFRPTATYPIGQLNPAGYTTYGIMAGCVILVSILTASIGTHRYIPYLKSPPPKRPVSLPRALGEIRRTLFNPSLVMLLISGISGSVASGISAGLSLYVNTYFWGLSAAKLAMLLPASLIGSATGAFVAPVLSRRLGKRRASVILAIVAATIGVSPLLLRLQGWFPANGSDALIVILFGTNVTAIALGVAASVLISSMLIDVVEENELSTGRRAEGLVLAANVFIQKCVSGVGILVSGLLVSVVHFPVRADPATLDPSIIRNLVLLVVPTLIALQAVTIFFISRYRITQQGHEANLQLLAAREAGTAPADAAVPASDLPENDAPPEGLARQSPSPV